MPMQAECRAHDRITRAPPVHFLHQPGVCKDLSALLLRRMGDGFCALLLLVITPNRNAGKDSRGEQVSGPVPSMLGGRRHVCGMREAGFY